MSKLEQLMAEEVAAWKLFTDKQAEFDKILAPMRSAWCEANRAAAKEALRVELQNEIENENHKPQS